MRRGLTYTALEALTLEEIDQQWPGFEVKCKACGNLYIELQNDMGYSAESGSWGSIDLVCLKCNARTSLVES